MNNIITNEPVQSATALAALRQVMDPEIGLNIVDLGLVCQIDFDNAAKEIFVSMTLTTQFCPMGESIRSGALNVLQQAFPQYAAHIQLVFDPPWTAERISEQGKEFLKR
jgi:metal-sulfur cluster biosynthetic enzyme